MDDLSVAVEKLREKVSELENRFAFLNIVVGTLMLVVACMVASARIEVHW
jgi:hypothetical protein